MNLNKAISIGILIFAFHSASAQVVMEHNNNTFKGLFVNCLENEKVDFRGVIHFKPTKKGEYQLKIEGIGIGRDSEVNYEVKHYETFNKNGNHNVLLTELFFESRKMELSSFKIKLIAYFEISDKGHLVLDFFRLGKMPGCQNIEF